MFWLTHNLLGKCFVVHFIIKNYEYYCHWIILGCHGWFLFPATWNMHGGKKQFIEMAACVANGSNTKIILPASSCLIAAGN
jgi:hypothetical protein